MTNTQLTEKIIKTVLIKAQSLKAKGVSDADTIGSVADDIEAILIQHQVEVVEKVQGLEELHKHNSIPCLTGDEDEGCVTCVKNKTLESVIKLLEEKS